MNEWSGPMWNDCGACNWIRRSAVQYPRVMCAQHRGESMLSLANLASNLRIAAGLTLAWDSGRQFGFASCPCEGYLDDEDYAHLYAEHWSPGCHRPAPGWVTP